jgi:hypothetical protein
MNGEDAGMSFWKPAGDPGTRRLRSRVPGIDMSKRLASRGRK